MPQDDDVHRRPHQQIRTGSARKTARGPAEAQPPAPPLRARKQTGGGTRPNGEPSTPGVRRPGPSMITPNNQHRLADVSALQLSFNRITFEPVRIGLIQQFDTKSLQEDRR